jgi:hypothetical protein
MPPSAKAVDGREGADRRPCEADYYRNGGIMHYVLHSLIRK